MDESTATEKEPGYAFGWQRQFMAALYSHYARVYLVIFDRGNHNWKGVCLGYTICGWGSLCRAGLVSPNTSNNNLESLFYIFGDNGWRSQIDRNRIIQIYSTSWIFGTNTYFYRNIDFLGELAIIHIHVGPCYHWIHLQDYNRRKIYGRTTWRQIFGLSKKDKTNTPNAILTWILREKCHKLSRVPTRE